jgi:hypothetical protein
MYMLKPYMAGKNITYEQSVKQERKTHLKNLKSTTSFIVETGQNAPPKKIASIMANPRKKMKEQERFNAIEAENARLLSRMTKIMDAGPRLSVLHRTKVFISNAPTRRNEALHVAKLNQVVLERLNKTGPFYDHKQWAKDRKATEHILGGMGLYPYVPPPAKKADDFFEKDPLSDKAYESKLDEQWAESLTAFASRSSVLDQEFEKPGQGRRAVSLTPSSLKRPGNDDWMLPGLGRPGIYSYAKEGKTMQVIPDGRLPYQFSARTPSPKQKKSADSIVRSDIIPKNVLIVKAAAPALQLDDDVTTEKYSEMSNLMSKDVKPANSSRPASAARASSSRPASAARASSSRPASAARPTSAGTVNPDEMRPSSAERPVGVVAAPNSRPLSASAEPLQAGAQDTAEFENDTIADSSASFQGSEVILESTANQTSSDFPAENSALSVSKLLETGHAIEEHSSDQGVSAIQEDSSDKGVAAIQEDSADKGVNAIEEHSSDKGDGEVMQAGSSADTVAEISDTLLLPNSEQMQNIRQDPDSETSTMLQSAAAIDDQSALIDSGKVGIVEAGQASDSQAVNDAGMTETKDM